MSKDWLKPTLWYTLLKLSELGALNTRVNVSTIELAREMGVSQQTASRHLIELASRGYIERQPLLRGTNIKITLKGRGELERAFLKLRRILEEKPLVIVFEGSVVSGLGEGAYYMSRRGYREQFIKKLGFKPFPGTLNLRLAPYKKGVRSELSGIPAIIIEGFESGRRTFGKVKCFPATINDMVEGAVVLIDRTHHDDSIIELIAPINLRNKLGLEEGSRVKVKIGLRKSVSSNR